MRKLVQRAVGACSSRKKSTRRGPTWPMSPPKNLPLGPGGSAELGMAQRNGHRRMEPGSEAKGNFATTKAEAANDQTRGDQSQTPFVSG